MSAPTRPSEVLTVGYPAHVVYVFARLESGQVFWIADCGERGLSEKDPQAGLSSLVCCPRCFGLLDGWAAA